MRSLWRKDHQQGKERDLKRSKSCYSFDLRLFASTLWGRKLLLFKSLCCDTLFGKPQQSNILPFGPFPNHPKQTLTTHSFALQCALPTCPPPLPPLYIHPPPHTHTTLLHEFGGSCTKHWLISLKKLEMPLLKQENLSLLSLYMLHSVLNPEVQALCNLGMGSCDYLDFCPDYKSQYFAGEVRPRKSDSAPASYWRVRPQSKHSLQECSCISFISCFVLCRWTWWSHFRFLVSKFPCAQGSVFL